MQYGPWDLKAGKGLHVHGISYGKQRQMEGENPETATLWKRTSL